MASWRQALIAACFALAIQSSYAAVSLYKVLGVEQNATKEQITKAFRRQSLEWHPDKNPSPDATSKFQELSEAYEVLGNEQRRADYDSKSFIYDIPQVQSLEKFLALLKEHIVQHPLYIRVTEAWAAPPQQGIPTLLRLLAHAVRILSSRLLPRSSSAAWQVSEAALESWLNHHQAPGLNREAMWVACGWWAVALGVLGLLGWAPLWVGVLLGANGLAMSYYEGLGAGSAQQEAPAGELAGRVGALHTLLIVAFLLGLLLLLLRAAHLAIATASTLYIAAVVGSLSTPQLYIILLQAAFLIRLIMWNPLIGLPGPIFLLFWIPNARKLPYYVLIKAVRPFAMWAAFLLFSARSAWRRGPMRWEGHSNISFLVAATYRLTWQLPLWLIDTAVRWVLLGTGVALAAIPWYSFTNLVPASTPTGLKEQPEGSAPASPATDATEGLPPTSTVVYYSYVYVASAITVLFVLLGLLRHGLPALSLKGGVSGGPEAPSKADGDGGAKAEPDVKEEGRSQFMTDSGVTPKSGNGKGAVRRR